jgi:hypothetical protein
MIIKLNRSIHISEYEVKQHVVSYGGRITYNVVSTPFNNIFGLVPERYQKDFFLTSMSISGSVPPHTDSGILSTINIYIKPDVCKTTFYKMVTNTPTTMQVENQTNGKIFSMSSLEEIGSFVAEKDDAWLLDVTLPHSVTSANSSISRFAVCLQSNKHTADDVRSMLIETNHIE